MLRSQRAWSFLTVCLCSALVMFPAAEHDGADQTVITAVPPEDTLRVLSNPDMGWVLYENHVIDPANSTITTAPEETFPGVDHVAVMFSWADVERGPGIYDFTRVDAVCDFWRAKGKGIHLRMSCESLLWWNHRTPPAGLGIPPHLLARLPAEAQQVRTYQGKSYTVVDARLPLYRESLRRFLVAVAEHYQGPRAVGLVDLRGFGLWGEWHSGYRYADDDQRRAALIGIIDLHAAAFPRHWLSLSYSHDPDGPRELFAGPTNRLDPDSTATYDAFLRYSAFDHALTRPNITWRRDGVGGAVYSNQRRLCEQAFALRRGPFMSEFVAGYFQTKKGDAEWMRWVIDDALSLHPNYVSLLGWQHNEALAFLREQPELVAHGHRTMGYRLVPTRVSHPRRVWNRQPFTIASEWTNRGVGRCLEDLTLTWLLKTADGRVAARIEAGQAGASTWLRGATTSLHHRVTIGDLVPGRYALCVLLKTASGSTIALPLGDADTHTSYPTGSVVEVGDQP
jgi:hypothetical protein